jgi:hypothetical protein
VPSYSYSATVQVVVSSATAFVPLSNGAATFGDRKTRVRAELNPLNDHWGLTHIGTPRQG